MTGHHKVNDTEENILLPKSALFELHNEAKQ